MELSDAKIREMSFRLLRSRTRVLCSNGFYGLLLMHMKYVLNTKVDTAYTDGDEIGFNPSFLEQLSEDELDFVMMHEILHVVLQHCTRYQQERMDTDLWNIACDIVVNSNILKSCDMRPESISIRAFGGESMHLTPEGEEGHLYTMEQVYAMLEKEAKRRQKKSGNGSSQQGTGNGSSQQGSGSGSQQNGRAQGGGGAAQSQKGGKSGKAGRKSGKDQWQNGGFDDHSKWGKGDEKEAADQAGKWQKRMMDAAETMRIADPQNGRGTVPAGVWRVLEELRRPKLDWRTVLNEFVQEEITDYSFSPPDKRFDGFDFYLPDYNETEERLGNVLFMVDTSGSVSDGMMSDAFAEICGAIEQFSGKLTGKLGFFDDAVYEPVPFESVEDVKSIRPRGGGGTSFHAIFRYVRYEMAEDPPVSIVILTDGYAPYPHEAEAEGIPVLWVISGLTDEVRPPWGRVVGIE